MADELENASHTLNQLPSDEVTFYKILAEKDLEIKLLTDRLKSANKMCTSYMNEFEKRGLVYIPCLNTQIE